MSSGWCNASPTQPIDELGYCNAFGYRSFHQHKQKKHRSCTVATIHLPYGFINDVNREINDASDCQLVKIGIESELMIASGFTPTCAHFAMFSL